MVTTDAKLTRESYYFAFVFLELPLSVYKNWYLYSERYVKDEDKFLKMQERQNVEQQALVR